MMERILGWTKKAEKEEITNPGNSTQDVLQLSASIYEYCKISVEECHI
jgi:ribosomal protein L6P/L9E